MNGESISVLTNPIPAEEDREAQRARRHHRAWKTTKAGFAAKVFSMAVRVLTIPLAFHLLGPERYGLWLSVSSMILWFGFAGSGFGSGLVNVLSRELAASDIRAMRVHTSTAVFSLAFMGFVTLCGTLLLAGWPGLPSLLGLGARADLALEARYAVLAAGFLFAASFALEFNSPLCSGLQEGYLTSVSWIAASVGSLLWMLLLSIRGGGIVDYALAMSMPSILANFFLAVYLFAFRHRALRPSWRLCSMSSFRQQMSFGSWMLLGQVAELALVQSANILIANRFGPAAVPRYAVAAAILQNIALLCYGSVQPYWPAITEARFRQDWAWIREAVIRTLKISLGLMLLAAAGLLVAGRFVIRIWAGPEVVPSQMLLFAMCVYFVLTSWSLNNRVVLLGLGKVRLRVLLTCGVAAVQVAGFFVLSPSIGLIAFPVAGAIGLICEGIIASSSYMRAIHTHQNS